MLDTSARKITEINNTERSKNQRSGTPDPWSGGNVGPRGSRIINHKPQINKTTLSYRIFINNSTDMLYVICNKPHSIYKYLHSFVSLGSKIFDAMSKNETVELKNHIPVLRKV